MVPEIFHMEYEDRLKTLTLYPLHQRRTRGDMITTYKIINGLINISQDICPLATSNTSTRSHGLQLSRKVCKTDMRHNFYTQRIIEPWNKLSKLTVYSPTVESFKANYDREVLGDYN